MSNGVLNVFQIVLSVLLIFLIMIQARAGGLGSAFGGFSSVYRSKRGFERLVYILTIIVSIIFFLVSFINFYLSR